MDHGAWAAGLGPKGDQRDRKAEAARARYPRIQAKEGACVFDTGPVRMARDHDIPPLGFRLSPQILAIVYHVDVRPLDREADRFGHPTPLGATTPVDPLSMLLATS